MKNNTLTAFTSILVLITIFFTALTFAQERVNTAGLSMGRIYVASSRGLEAIGTNPANLTLPHRDPSREIVTEKTTHDTLIVAKDTTGKDTSYVKSVTHDTTFVIISKPPTLSLAIPPFSFGQSFGSDFINYDIYKRYFTGVPNATGGRDPYQLTDVDKNNILEVFPAGVSFTHLDFEMRYFGLTIHGDALGDIGLSVTDKVATNLDIPKDYVRFAFFGLDSTGSSYDFTGTSVRAWYVRQYSLSYARNLPMLNYKYFSNVSAGIGIKVVHGFAAVITEKYNATIENRVRSDGGWDIVGNFDSRILRSTSFNPDDDNEKFDPLGTPAGTGLGFDVGVSADVYPAIRAAVSVTDIGSILWTKNTKETIGSGSFVMSNPADKAQLDSLKDAFAGKDTTTGEFSIALPSAFHLGASIQVDQLPFINWFPGHMLISLEYEQGFNNSPGNTTRARFAIGTEYRPVRWFPIRTGISFGGIDRSNWGAGFGFDFGGFNWNFGTENLGLVFSNNNWDQVSFGTSMIIRI